jgi:hypothetical protein
MAPDPMMRLGSAIQPLWRWCKNDVLLGEALGNTTIKSSSWQAITVDAKTTLKELFQRIWIYYLWCVIPEIFSLVGNGAMRHVFR